jgi:hypothetical protein
MSFAQDQAAIVFCEALGLSFLISAWTKAHDMEAFRLIAMGYPGVSRLGVRASASIIVLAETVIGTALIGAMWRTDIGATAAILWIVTASGAIALRRMRGEKRFQCGCGSDLSEETSAALLLVRNTLLLAGLAAVLAFTSDQPISSSELTADLLTAAAVLLSIHLLRAATRTWRRVREW